jgi:hypothetical protein
VPASKSLTTWYPANQWRDAYVTIPSSMNGLQLLKIEASYGDSWPDGATDLEWHLELRDQSNTVLYDETWNHTTGNRKHTHVNTGNIFTLTAGYTLNVQYRTGGAFSESAQGYSVTATFQ